MNIQPIPTHYNGYFMRSRSEARWATFLDKLAIKYRYEPERVNEGYLPDFWLIDCKIWFEVKGEPPTDEEKKDAKGLCLLSKSPVIIGYGDIEVGSVRQDLYAAFLDHEGTLQETDKALWTVCNHCGEPDVYIHESEPHHLCLHDGHLPTHEKLLTASRLARSARFTRGQNTTYRRRFI